jgi:hypothetical protein
MRRDALMSYEDPTDRSEAKAARGLQTLSKKLQETTIK